MDFGEKVLQLYQVRIESVLEFSELGCNVYFCQVIICELIKIKLVVKKLTIKGHYIEYSLIPITQFFINFLSMNIQLFPF